MPAFLGLKHAFLTIRLLCFCFSRIRHKRIDILCLAIMPDLSARSMNHCQISEASRKSRSFSTIFAPLLVTIQAAL